MFRGSLIRFIIIFKVVSTATLRFRAYVHLIIATGSSILVSVSVKGKFIIVVSVSISVHKNITAYGPHVQLAKNITVMNDTNKYFHNSELLTPKNPKTKPFTFCTLLGYFKKPKNLAF